MDDIYKLGKSFQDQILRKETSALSWLEVVFRDLEARIEKDLEELEKITKGRPFSLLRPGESVRYSKLLAVKQSLTESLTKLGTLGPALTDSIGSVAPALAIDHVKRAAVAQLGENVAPAITVGDPKLGPAENLRTFAGFNGSAAYDELFSSVAGNATAELQKAFAYHLAVGTSPESLAREIRNTFNISRHRSQTIARTELLRAYRETTRRVYEQNADIIKGYIWVARLTTRTCAVCWAMHGSFHLVSEPFGTHPACLVEGTTVNSPKTKAATRREYEGEVIEIETSSGFRLTVTPNHPIMTPFGWLAAQFLKKGDNVVSASDSQGMISTVNPNDDNRPALVEKVFESFVKAPGMTSALVPAAAENFHGDGTGGDVDIVLADGFLGDSLNASLVKPFVNSPLIGGNIRLADLYRSSSFTHGIITQLRSLVDSMSGRNISGVFGLCPFGHHQPIGVGVGSPGNIVLDQNPLDYISRNAELLRDLIFGDSSEIFSNNGLFGQYDFLSGPSDAAVTQSPVEGRPSDLEFCQDFIRNHAGSVSVDRIVKIRNKFYRGHVYNLETSTGYYIANNIITHNCRCVMIPYLGGKAPVSPGAFEFAKLSPKKQKAILGPGKFELYEAGELGLSDVVGFRNHPKYGPTRFEKSIGAIEAQQLTDQAFAGRSVPPGSRSDAVNAAREKLRNNP